MVDQLVQNVNENVSSQELMDEIDALLHSDDEVNDIAEIQKRLVAEMSLSSETEDVNKDRLGAAENMVAKDIVRPSRNMAKKTSSVGHCVVQDSGVKEHSEDGVNDSGVMEHSEGGVKDSRVKRKFENFIVAKSYGKPLPRLNESVVDFGMIRGKFSAREQLEMVQTKLKKERDDPPCLLNCNIC